ncbi:regulator of ribonuclease activity B [Lapillicoccus jejuensis]|uniref:Regulator of ribonuclease activity B n=1 Tax=Lapillicoccus jejuensis TaxID=402171 RepID=A0A542DZY1_9MICO|nr:regulator of ribonuclease activity B [Lapillicoccus jejuensis]
MTVGDPTEHLLVFDDRETAEAVADSLDHHVYAVRVLREALAGDDDAEDAQWLVHVTDPRDLDETARETERRHLGDLAERNDGWYDDADDDDAQEAVASEASSPESVG